MFLKFNTDEEFNTWHDQVNIALGYTGNNQYTELLPTKNGEIICPIDLNCPQQFLLNKTILNYDDIQMLLLNTSKYLQHIPQNRHMAVFNVKLINGEPDLTVGQIQYCIDNDVTYYINDVINNGVGKIIVSTADNQIMNEIKALPEFEFIEDVEVLK